MNLQEIERRLLALLKEGHALLPSSEMQEMIELVQAGEPGIGLENFCTQLYEHDVVGPPRILVEISCLGGAMGIQPRYWERLKKGSTSS